MRTGQLSTFNGRISTPTHSLSDGTYLNSPVPFVMMLHLPGVCKESQHALQSMTRMARVTVPAGPM